MATSKWKTGRGMIETHIGPTAGVMTGAAFRAELAVVMIVCFMTCIANGCSPLINAVDMAGCASHIEMSACQYESCLTVVEIHITPSTGHMAAGTVRPELPIVLVVILVTGEAFLRRSTITACMAIPAFYFRMFSGQLEVGEFMIERPIFPAAGVMAGGAILPKAAIMLVILLVA